MTANGGLRYVWIISAEHPAGGAAIWRDACGFKMGFSADPGILPDTVIDIIPINNRFDGNASTIPGTAAGQIWTSDMAPSTLLYNSDDASYPFYLYTQGLTVSGSSIDVGTTSIMWKSADMYSWIPGAWSPKNISDDAVFVSPGVLTSFQRVTRNSTGDWTSFGTVGDLGRMGNGIWTGTNGKDFVYPSTFYNYTGHSTVNLTLSGTTLTAASSIFASGDVGKGVAISWNGGASMLGMVGTTTTRIATYVSGTQVTLSQNPVGATLSAQHLPFQFGPVSVATAPAPSVLGGTSNFYPSQIGPTVSIAGQNYSLMTEDARHPNQAPDDGMHASLAPIDASGNISQTVPVIRIADYAAIYTGPTYPSGQNGYYEDGILHVYVQLGYPGPHGANPFPFVGARCTGSISSTTLTLTAVSGFVTIGAMVINNAPGGDFVGQITSQSSGTTGSTGVYVIENSQGVSASAGTSISINAGTNYNTESNAAQAGFRQQFINYYTYSVNDAYVAAAAPFGVAASCSSNTVTISWLAQTAPTGAPQTYKVYRGTTAGTQATVVGTTSSLSITDTPTPGSIYYYRVVKVAGGVEQTTKYRIVHTYVG